MSHYFFTPALDSAFSLLVFFSKGRLTRVIPWGDPFGFWLFISAGFVERLKIAKKLSDQIGDEEVTKAQVSDFISEIELAFKNNISGKPFQKEEIFVFEQIEKCRKYLSDRAPSVKMILEHLAIILN